jgi:hypothetical protein
VSKWEKFRSKILSGQCDGNIDFAELVNYLRRCGFDQRIRGSHNLFTKNGIDALSAEQAVSLWLETARSQGREIPNPKGKLAFA